MDLLLLAFVPVLTVWILQTFHSRLVKIPLLYAFLLAFLVLFIPNILYLLDKFLVIFPVQSKPDFHFNRDLNPIAYPDLPVFADGFARAPLALSLKEVLDNWQISFAPQYNWGFLECFLITFLVILAFGYCSDFFLRVLKINRFLKYFSYFLLMGIALYLGNLARFESWDSLVQPKKFFVALTFLFYPYISIYILTYFLLTLLLFAIYKVLIVLANFFKLKLLGQKKLPFKKGKFTENLKFF